MARYRAVILTLLAFGVSTASEAASNCNPVEFHDKTAAFRDVQARLLYAEDITLGRADAGSGLDFFDIAGLEGQARTNYVDHLKELANVHFKESDRRFLYMSEMSDNELKAYLGCLSHQNIFIVPSAGSARFRILSVKLSLRKGAGEGEVPVTVHVTGAKIIGADPGNWRVAKDNTQASGRMKPGADAHVRLSRNRGKAFEITVSAGSEHESLTLPAPPTKTLVEEIRYSPALEIHCNECRNASMQAGTLTIAVPNDELIKPRSEYVESFSAGSAPNFSPHTGGVYAGLDVEAYSQKYNPHDLHVPVSVAPAAAPAPWCGIWAASVKVFVAVPIGTTSSGRQKPKPDTACHLP